jgi:hypothetical protein
MKQEYINAIKCMVFAQSTVEAIDQMKGSNAFKHQLKNKANGFIKELDKFLDTVYDKGETSSSMYSLIEGCQKAIDGVIENDVEVIE